MDISEAEVDPLIDRIYMACAELSGTAPGKGSDALYASIIGAEGAIEWISKNPLRLVSVLSEIRRNKKAQVCAMTLGSIMDPDSPEEWVLRWLALDFDDDEYEPFHSACVTFGFTSRLKEAFESVN